MNVVVIGNCQSRPISTLLSALCPDANMLPEIVVHLASDSDAEQNYNTLNSTDVIFAQSVQDNYPVSHLATSKLKSEFGNKVVSWPNAFFVGQSPDVVCVNSKNTPRVLGPLDVYHLKTVLSAWQSDVSMEHCIQEMTSAKHVDESVLQVCKHSLQELKLREVELDVGIADYIEEYWLVKRLFHVFNHPTNLVLIELATRLCKAADLKISNVLLPEFWPESLNRVVPPTLNSVEIALGFTFACSPSSKGFLLDCTNGTNVKLGEVSILPLATLVELFYKAYDAQLERTESLTFTPKYLETSFQLPYVA